MQLGEKLCKLVIKCNWMQIMQLQATSFNFVQLHATFCTFVQLRATLCNFVQLCAISCNFMQLRATLYNIVQSYYYVQLHAILLLNAKLIVACKLAVMDFLKSCSKKSLKILTIPKKWISGFETKGSPLSFNVYNIYFPKISWIFIFSAIKFCQW